MSFFVSCRSWQMAPKARALASSASLHLRRRRKQLLKWTGELLQPNHCMWLWLSGGRSVKRFWPISTCSDLLPWGPWRVQSSSRTNRLDTTWLYLRCGCLNSDGVEQSCWVFDFFSGKCYFRMPLEWNMLCNISLIFIEINAIWLTKLIFITQPPTRSFYNHNTVSNMRPVPRWTGQPPRLQGEWIIRSMFTWICLCAAT